MGACSVHANLVANFDFAQVQVIALCADWSKVAVAPEAIVVCNIIQCLFTDLKRFTSEQAGIVSGAREKKKQNQDSNTLSIPSFSSNEPLTPPRLKKIKINHSLPSVEHRPGWQTKGCF